MFLLLYICFFTSGVTALVFEVLWTRQITREMGGAAFAISVVLTIFMAGLGSGAWLGGRLAERISARNPKHLLLAYGLAEVAAALLALIVPFGLKLWHAPLAFAYSHSIGSFLPYQVIVLLASLTVLLPPTMAMGMSLPLLTRFCVRSQSQLGRHFGGLYAVNTVGAACGAVLAGFFLIPYLGLPITLGMGVIANFGIAGTCLFAYIKIPWIEKPTATLKPISQNPETSNRIVKREAILAVILLTLSGFCALAYEVIWTKLLALIFGPTTYAFTVVLAVFITGLALGGWFFGRLADSSPRVFAWLLATQGGAAFLALAISQRMGNSLAFFEKALWHFHLQFGMLFFVKASYAFFLLLGPTFLMGAALPLCSKLWGRYRLTVGLTVGDTYLWNTIGSMLGSWLAGFVFLPFLGKEVSLRMLTLVQASAVLGAWAAFHFWIHSKRNSVSIIGVTTACIASLFCLVWPNWPRESLARSNSLNLGPELGVLSWPKALFASNSKASGDGSMAYYGDGLEGFTAVWKAPDLLGNMEWSLFLSGKADASSSVDMFTQTLLAHFPMALIPNPKDVMVMGLASGTTAGEILHYPVDRVDVLEINPKVIEAATFFTPWNNKVLQNPKAHIYTQDAKAHLLLSGRKYDAIISEPSNPWMAGLAELFTQDFYQRARHSLKENGVMVQFIHSYKMDWETLALVGRTFHSVFPNSILIRTMPDDRSITESASDYLLVGFNGNRPWSIDSSLEKQKQMSSSQNVEILNPKILTRLVVAENLGEIFGPGELHTDNHPYLEFRAPRLMYAFQSARIESEIAKKARLAPQTLSEIDNQKADPFMRLAFGAYALSLKKPFPNMASQVGVKADMHESYAKRVDNYCADNVVGDFSPFIDDIEILRRCSVIQMEVLKLALSKTNRKAEVFLEMSNTCMAINMPTNAVTFLRLAAEAAPGTKMAEYALEQEERITKALKGFEANSKSNKAEEKTNEVKFP